MNKSKQALPLESIWGDLSEEDRLIALTNLEETAQISPASMEEYKNKDFKDLPSFLQKHLESELYKHSSTDMETSDAEEAGNYETDERDIQQREAYGPEDLDEEAYRILEEQSFTEPEPEDYVMYDSGPLGAKTSVGVVEGDFLGEFGSEDTAMEAILDDQRKNNFYSNIWKMDDHGG